MSGPADKAFASPQRPKALPWRVCGSGAAAVRSLVRSIRFRTASCSRRSRDEAAGRSPAGGPRQRTASTIAFGSCAGRLSTLNWFR